MKNKKTRPYNSLVRQKQAEETKNRIADAAEVLIKEQGYENTTIGAIAKSAGVATQTVYAIFNSKQGILIHLLRRSFGSFTKQETNFQTCVEAGDLTKLAQQVASAVTKHGHQQISIMNSLGGFDILYPELYGLITEAAEARHKAVVEGMEKGLALRKIELSDRQKKLLADIMWAFTDNHLYHALVVYAGWPQEDYEKLFARVIEFVFREIAPELIGKSAL